MAVLKHIAIKDAHYSDIIDYLRYQHNEETGQPILDEAGHMLLRDEYYMDGLLCEPMMFDVACEETNKKYHKNCRYDEIKCHHFIISFDPKDVSDHGLTGEKAQMLCLEYAKKYFPGHQAIVVTHTDGHNGSGNIHTHIAINSLRAEDVPEQDFMERDCDHKAGYKHHLTRDYLKYLEKAVMDMCEEQGLYQVDLLNPSEKKITQEEYWAQRRGQKRLEALNKEIIEAGLKPRNSSFATQKETLRNAISEIASIAQSFEEFKDLMDEKYSIDILDNRGRYSYKLPDREKRISERSLGSRYGKNYLEQIFEKNRNPIVQDIPAYHRNPEAIFYYKTTLRLVVNLQTCVKAQQNRAYAQKVKISNLQQMAETLIYVQDHEFDTRDTMNLSVNEVSKQLIKSRSELSSVDNELADIKEDLRLMNQYLQNKRIYQQMTKSANKGKFRNEHREEIAAYEEAVSALRKKYPNTPFPSKTALYGKRHELINRQNHLRQEVRSYQNQLTELLTACANVDEILNSAPTRKQEREPSL